eukprot:jgi/Mesen1/119/ME1125055C07641
MQSTDLQARAVKNFQEVLRYMGLTPDGELDRREQLALVLKLLKGTLKRPELRDELFAQLNKQTRNNPDKNSCVKAWELMHLCVAAMPPGKDLAGPYSIYIHEHANSHHTDPEIRSQAIATWQALRRSIKAGPRKHVPTLEEMEALVSGRKLTTMEVAGLIKLHNYQTFGLFECRKAIPSAKGAEAQPEEHMGLDDSRYIGDVVYDL